MLTRSACANPGLPALARSAGACPVCRRLPGLPALARSAGACPVCRRLPGLPNIYVGSDTLSLSAWRSGTALDNTSLSTGASTMILTTLYIRADLALYWCQYNVLATYEFELTRNCIGAFRNQIFTCLNALISC